MHLLSSVFLTPNGLPSNRNSYRIKPLAPEEDPFFRVGRFLTSLWSLRKVNFSSAYLYISVDKVWATHEEAIVRSVREILPESTIRSARLSTAAEWLLAAEKFPQSDAVLLHANDDHAIVSPGGVVELERLDRTIQAFGNLRLASVTHFLEDKFINSVVVEGQEDSPYMFGKTSLGLGNQLVRGDFLRSWFLPENLHPTEAIVRPDNPFGRSVHFQEEQVLLPNREVMRHMDGYGHILSNRPLGPLRNLLLFNPEDRGVAFRIAEEEWVGGLWPQRILGFSGEGCDFHLAERGQGSRGFLKDIRLQVAVIQGNFGFRLSSRPIRWIIDEHRFVRRSLAAAIALLSYPVARNIPDLLFQRLVAQALFLLRKLTGRQKSRLEQRINVFGLCRAIIVGSKPRP